MNCTAEDTPLLPWEYDYNVIFGGARQRQLATSHDLVCITYVPGLALECSSRISNLPKQSTKGFMAMQWTSVPPGAVGGT